MNNLKQSGSAAVQCDPGLPISGRSADAGSYNILRVNPDGSTGTQSAYAGSRWIQTPGAIAVTPGSPASETYLGNLAVNPSGTAILEGMYAINPTALWEGAAGGGLNFVIYAVGTPLDAYISGLTSGNTFAPTSAQLSSGLAAFWHGVGAQLFGSGLNVAYNRTNTLEAYLAAGTYNIAVITNGTVNFTAGTLLMGFYQFARL